MGSRLLDFDIIPRSDLDMLSERNSIRMGPVIVQDREHTSAGHLGENTEDDAPNFPIFANMLSLIEILQM